MIKRLEAIRGNVSSFPTFTPILVEYLRSLCQSFQGGQVSHYWHEWTKLTSDNQILADIRGIKIECVENPTQHRFNQRFNKNETRHLQKLLHEMENKQIIKVAAQQPGQILSSIFLRPKKDGTYRLILNLKKFNENVEYHHFKMDSLTNIIRIMERGCYMASIDIKDAYFSFAINSHDQKFLCFQWENRTYQFTCLPNGLSSAPRNFTKLLKVPLSQLHKQGHISLGHLDDFYLQGNSYKQCLTNVIDTIILFSRLGFVVHPDKSVFVPSQIITILGCTLNSNMTVKLTKDKITGLTKACQSLLDSKSLSIRDVARVIGKIVSSFPGTSYGPLYYRALDRDKTHALKLNKGNFDAQMILSSASKSELCWWVNNIAKEQNNIERGPPTLQITTDASSSGWGAECQGISTGGQWSFVEAQQHINYLELYAAFLGLQTFAKNKYHMHIRLRLDNTTGVSVINHMGTSHSDQCNKLCKTIWEWCIQRHIWISAAHLPGSLNTVADTESRCKNNNLEWMINPDILQHALKQLSFKPEIDLFASRINKQFPVYASYRPDPNAMAIDAFTIQWTDLKLYAFPPFSVIPLVIHKICQDQAQGIIVIPEWTTQYWYPKVLQLLKEAPVKLKASTDLLQLPQNPQAVHPLHVNLNLLVCHLLGKDSTNMDSAAQPKRS